MNDDDDISSLWQRHLMTTVRDNLSTASVQAIPLAGQSFDGDEGDLKAGVREVPAGASWDEQIDSVVDALEELTIPTTINTTETYSPEAPWFTDREGYTETALSSPQNSSWSRTIAPPKTMKTKRLSSHEETIQVSSNNTSPLKDKGKGLASPSDETPTRQEARPAWYTEQHLSTPNPGAPENIESYCRNYNANARDVPPDPPTVTVRYAPHRASQIHDTPPEQVHVLILTWAKNDRRGDDGQLLSPTMDLETDAVRACFKRRGYRVQCRHVPEDYPTAAVETILDRFLDKSGEKSLLVVYYHGFGSMQGGRMVFSSDQTATSSFFWEDIRDPIMQSPGDILLIFDCCPSPTNPPPDQPSPEPAETLIIKAGMVSSPSTKQLLGICAPTPTQQPPSAKTAGGATTSPSGIMTDSLCRVLDEKFGNMQVSVQGLCSSIREDLRLSSGGAGIGNGDGVDLSSRVFVTQLGGGRLGDICLPWFRD